MIVHPFIQSDNRHFIFYIFKDIVLVCLDSHFLWIAMEICSYTAIGACMAVMVDVVTSELSSFSCLVLAILCGAVVVSSPVVE